MQYHLVFAIRYTGMHTNISQNGSL